MSDYEDNDGQQNGPAELRKALEKANKEKADLAARLAAAEKKAAQADLASILSDKKVPANVQRWLKRDDVEPTEAAVDKWLAENGADFGWKPGEEPTAEAEAGEGAAKVAAPVQSAVTPEVQNALERMMEVFGGDSGAPHMPADQVKAAVDDVAQNVQLGYMPTDYAEAVRMLRDKGIPIGGEINIS